MAGDPQAQQFTSFHGEAVTFLLTGTDNTDPSGYAMTCTVAAAPGGAALVAVSTPAITVTGSGPYVIRIPFTRAHTGTTLTAGSYVVDVWRTDAGSEKRLAGWTWTLVTPVRAAS